jgi:hypothetical protein
VFDTPILFLIFNRPDLTEKVFQRIQEIQPKQLFIAADGPRSDSDADNELCRQAKELVLNNINWNCTIQTLFRDKNLGCKIAVTEAINWFFTHVESGIILEDDALPEKSFFTFCESLLKKYKNEEHIFHISGNNFQLSNIGDGSYYLSKLPHIWGWATWKRAWKNFDATLKSFDENKPVAYFDEPEIDLFWKQQFARVKNNPVDEWDYQWVHALFNNNAYALQPQYNLVKNIGFDERGLRTKSDKDFLADLKTYPINTIVHPDKLTYDKTADINFQKFFNWNIPIYENRMSGTQALKVLKTKAAAKIFKH